MQEPPGNSDGDRVREVQKGHAQLSEKTLDLESWSLWWRSTFSYDPSWHASAFSLASLELGGVNLRFFSCL